MARLLYHLFFAVIKVHIYQFLPERFQRKFAEKRVLREIQQAYKNVPFYRKKYNDAGVDIKSIKTIADIKKLPLVTKDEIRHNFPDNIIEKNTRIEKCHYSATTGSTGKSLPFIFSMKTYAYYIATNLRVYSMIGYRPWHKAVYIKFTSFRFPNLGPFFRRAHIPSVITVEEQIEMLKKEKPDILIGYASIIHEIARKVTIEDLEFIKPSIISLNSEMSSVAQREFIESKFKCRVYDEYSTEETWMVSAQCRNRNYHIFTDNIWLEFIDEEGNEVSSGQVGEIILTTTRSQGMPFIRYRIGDLGIPSERTCNCGIKFPLLESFEGRADDSYILPDGRFVSSLKILNTFTMFIKKYLYLIEEFKAVQMDYDHVEILLVKGPSYEQEQFNELIEQLSVILGPDVRITQKFVQSIHSKDKIKRKAIESAIKERTNNEPVRM